MSGPRHTASIGGHKQGRESESDKDGPNTVAPAIKFGEGTITSAVQDFLERLHPGAPRTITVFKPRPDGLTVPGGRRGLVDAWISERDGVSDLYVLPGLVKGQPGRQPKKEHMLGSLWLWADLDPRTGEDEASERERILALLTSQLPAGVPPPTIIVDSGRGFWALWQLAEPCMETARIEAANLTLANAFGAVGDKCWNINRVMRLAGTINLKTGRRAKVVADEPGRVYSIDQFRAAETPPVPPSGEPPRGGNHHGAPGGAGEDSPRPTIIADLSELDRWRVPDRVRVIINQGHHPDQPKNGDNTRSAWLYDVVCNLLRCGVPDETILGIITDQTWAISESVLDKGRRAIQYARRQIEEARAEVELEEADFKVDKHGVPYANNQHNIRVALRKLGVRLSHDKFADRPMIDDLPDHGPTLQDAAVAELYLETDARFGFRPGKDFYWMVVENEARRHPYHPVRDYLDGLSWDRKPRVDRWLIDYGGVEDTDYTRAVSALVLLAAVRRVRNPGCKFDEMLVLRSPQGTDKSSALAALCPDSAWFSDDLPLNADTKVAIERLQGRWLVEAAELKGMRKSDVEHLKSFLSRQVDRARMAYARLPMEAPRQCVIIGTTNSERFLKDTTGNRRFWPVATGQFDLAGLRRDRDQLWAEAAHREAAGESIRLDAALYPAAALAQEEHRVDDPFVGRLADVLGNLEGKLKAEDAWEIVGVPPGQRNQDHNERLGEAMRELGWKRTRLRSDGKLVYWYVKGEASGWRRIEVDADQQGRVYARYDGDPPF